VTASRAHGTIWHLRLTNIYGRAGMETEDPWMGLSRPPRFEVQVSKTRTRYITKPNLKF